MQVVINWKLVMASTHQETRQKFHFIITIRKSNLDCIVVVQRAYRLNRLDISKWDDHP